MAEFVAPWLGKGYMMATIAMICGLLRIASLALAIVQQVINIKKSSR